MAAPLLSARLRALAAALEQGAELPDALARRLASLLDDAQAGTSGTVPSPGSSAASAQPPTAATGSAADAPGFLPGTVFRIWSDGSCAPNPGPGGWGCIVEGPQGRVELSGGAPASTNNIMEMTAALRGLQRTPPGATITLTTDSRYLMDGLTRWMSGWKRNGWRTSTGKAVLNQDLWRALDALVAQRQVRWEWVPSHTGHPENERCDELARLAREQVMEG